MHRGIVGVCDLCELVTLSFCVLTLENCTKIVLFSCCFLCQSSPSLVTFFLFGFFFSILNLISLTKPMCWNFPKKKKKFAMLLSNHCEIPFNPAEVLSGGECCTTFVPPDNKCSLLCCSKSNTSSPGRSLTGS